MESIRVSIEARLKRSPSIQVEASESVTRVINPRDVLPEMYAILWKQTAIDFER